MPSVIVTIGIMPIYLQAFTGIFARGFFGALQSKNVRFESLLNFSEPSWITETLAIIRTCTLGQQSSNARSL